MHGKDEVLVARVRNHLACKIACLERVLEVLDTVHPALSAVDWDALIQQHNVLADEMTRLETELKELAAAWALASGVAEAERARIRTLAQRVGVLAQEAGAAYRRVEQVLRAQTRDIQNELSRLGRGRDLLRKYRPGGLDDALFMDRKG